MIDSPEPVISVAISKGRILREALPLLDRAGFAPSDDLRTTRKLVVDTCSSNVKLIIVRSEDVPVYVNLGGADFGIVGKDILLESDNGEFYELLDLGLSRCKLVVAGKEDHEASCETFSSGKNRIATKYVNTTRKHFASKGLHVNVMKLTGSMELAPLCGIADRIVDLTGTGNTLRTNGLVELETIAPISARLIANKASMRLKHREMKEIVQRFEQTIAGGASDA